MRIMADSGTDCPLCGGDRTNLFMNAPDRYHGRRDRYELFSCLSCSCVWLKDAPKPQDMGFHYSEDYHRAIMAAGEKSAGSRWQRQREVIRKNKSGGAILDIGCSSGGFLGTMKGPNWKLYGIELSTSTAEKARASTGAEVFVGDVLDAPFAPDSFDVITGFDLVEHVYEPRLFLSKVLQWLKPGGIFYAGVPNINSWEARAFGTFWYGLELPRHLFHFSPQSVRYLTSSLGFKELLLTTTQTNYIEKSASYVYSALIESLGGSPVPMSKSVPRGIPSRALRKLLRITIMNPFGRVASAAGAGASIDIVVGKSNPSDVMALKASANEV
jgi:SAM-dependent methyltransferase